MSRGNIRLAAFEFVFLTSGFFGALFCIYHFSYYRSWTLSLRNRDPEYYPFVAHRSNDLRIVDSPMDAPKEESNIGLRVQGPVFSDAEMLVLYRLLKQLVEEHGSPVGGSYVNHLHKVLADGDETFRDSPPLEGARVLSPLTVDLLGYTPNRKPWSVGDDLKMNELPLILRYISSELRKTHPASIDDVRFVSIEHYPSGKPFIVPRKLVDYVGYDYFVVPIRAPTQRDVPLVVTMTPTNRSKINDYVGLKDMSWTSRDWDARIEKGCALHVFGQARFEWRMSVRPYQWFGLPANTLSRRVTEVVMAQPWWRKALGFKPETCKVPEEVPCPPGMEEDKGIILLTVGYTGATIKPRKKIFGMPERFYFGPRPLDAKKKWTDDGRQSWDAIDWSTIRSWKDIEAIGRQRFEAFVTGQRQSYFDE